MPLGASSFSLELAAVLIAGMAIAAPALRALYRLLRNAERIAESVEELRLEGGRLREHLESVDERLELIEGKTDVMARTQLRTAKRVQNVEHKIGAA